MSYERFSKTGDFVDGEDAKMKLDDLEGEDSMNGTNGVNNNDADKDGESDNNKDETLDAVVTKDEKLEEKPKENFTPKIGIKPLQLLTEPKAGSDAGGKEDVKMKIDDLIIIPNNINHAEEGGSALQNLAKIASRYSSLNKDKARSQEFSSPSPKKARVDEGKPGVTQALPPTTAAKKTPVVPGQVSSADQLSSTAASNLLQQFSLLSPGLFPGWPPAAGAMSPGQSPSPTSRSSSSTPSSAAAGQAAAAASWLGTGLGLDPSKIGQDGYQLLKYYEQQLKALQTGTSTPPKANGVKDSSPSKKESKSKEKSKVSKLPPDTKRPPRLIQTPCPYSQTASIYGSPQSELMKARDSASKTSSNTPSSETSSAKPETSILDLSSSSSRGLLSPRETLPSIRPAPLPVPVMTSSHTSTTSSTSSSLSNNVAKPAVASDSVLNLSRSTQSRDSSHTTTSDLSSVDLSTRTPASAPSQPVKASPFSAEALISKTPRSDTPATPTTKNLPPLSMGIKGILDTEVRRNSPQPSPALPRASPSSNHSPSVTPRVTSPWLTASKPAAPAVGGGLTPGLMRGASTPSSSASAASSLAALYSAGVAGYLGMPPASSIPGLSTETTFSSLSSLSSTSLAQPSLPQGSNPYLSALMGSSSLHPAPGGSKPPSALPTAAPGGLTAAAGIPGLNPLDPASQYYAALYQQQLAAYQHAASAAALNPYAAAAGIRPGYPPSAAAAAELQALQQYKDIMTRAAMGAGSLPPQSAASQAAQAAAAASNPYAALYGLMGYPGAGGFPGPAGGRKDS